MQPAQLDLDIYRGDSMRLRFKLYDKDKQPIDLTQVYAKSEIRNRPAGDDVTALMVAITLPNIVELFLPGDKSQKLPQNGVWDLQLSFGGGEVQTPIAGQVKVTPDVTDSTPTPTLLEPVEA